MENNEIAKTYLLRLFTDPRLKTKLPVSDIMRIGKQTYGLTRHSLREARKEIGAVSEKIEGVQVWCLPTEVGR